MTPTTGSLSGQVWSKFTPVGTLPSTVNVTIATGQFNYSTSSTTIPVAVGPTFTVVRTAGPVGTNQIVLAGTVPPGTPPAIASGFPATSPEQHDYQGTGVAMRYTFSSALPTGSHVWAQDIDASAVIRYQFYNCAGGLLDPSGYDYLIYSSAGQPARSFTSTQVTLTGGAASTAEPLGAIIIRSNEVCRVDATIVDAGTGSRQNLYFSIPQPRITLTKALSAVGRLANTDQFTTRIQSGATTLNNTTNSTTTGTAAVVTPGTGTTGATSVTLGGTYTLSEVGFGATTLASYGGTIVCTNSNAGSATVLPRGNGTSFSITPVNAADAISCILTNSQSVDLAITLTDNATQIRTPVARNYILTVTNNGPLSFAGALLTFPAATGGTKTAVACSVNAPGQCTGGTTPTVAQLQNGYNLPNLAPGDTYQLNVTVNVTATSGAFLNVATIARPTGFADAVASNNAANDLNTLSTYVAATNLCPVGKDIAVNGGFEAPLLPLGDRLFASTTGVPGWSTTDTAIEVWSTGFLGASSNTGNQFAEIAANDRSTLTQTGPLHSRAEVYMFWAHRGREGGDSSVLRASDNAGSSATAFNFNSDTTAWRTFGQSFVANTGASQFSMAFTPVSAGDGGPSRGNFLDSVSVCETYITLTSQYTALTDTNTDGIDSVGDVATLQVTVTNPASSLRSLSSSSVQVTDTVLGSFGFGATPSGDTNANGQLDPGETWTISRPRTLVAADITALSITSTAFVSGNTGFNTIRTDNAVATSALRATIDLQITKTNGVSIHNSGDTTSYTVTVTNAGPPSVTGAILSDPAITGLTVTSVACSGTPDQCVTPPSVSQLQSGTFALPTLTSGQTYQIVVNGTVTATSGTIANVATIAVPASGFADSATGNNSATDTDSVNGVSDLSITKTNSASGVTIGGTTSYTITVTNGGPQSTTGAILSDPAVSGLSKTAIACSGTPGQCASPPSVAQLEDGTFALPELASGQTYQIIVSVDVTASSGTVSNVATIAVPSGTVDLSTGDNSATDSDSVVIGSLSAPLCPANLASNNIIANGDFSTGTGPSWSSWSAAAIWTGTNQADVTSDTVSGDVSQSGLSGLIYGPSTSERAVVQLSVRWINQGTAGDSLSTTLGVFVAGTEYARITTPAGLGTTATITYFNGASGNISSAFDNTLTGWRIDLPADVATSGSISFAFTEGAGGIADDFTIDDVAVYTCTPAALAIIKTSALIVNGSNPAYHIPGNDMLYTIQVDNTSAGVTTHNSIFVYDTLPSELTFFNGDANGASAGTDAVIFIDNGSGLSWTSGSDLAYSNSISPPASFAACTYTPSAGYDANVRYICVHPKGTFAAKTSTPTPGFSLILRAQIK